MRARRRLLRPSCHCIRRQRLAPRGLRLLPPKPWGPRRLLGATESSPEKTSEDEGKAKAPAAKLPLPSKAALGAKGPLPPPNALGAKALPAVVAKAAGDQEHPVDAATKAQGSPEKTSEDEGKAKAPVAKLPLASKPVAGAAKAPAPLSKALGAKAVPSVEAKAGGDEEHVGEAATKTQASLEGASEDASKAKAPVAKLQLAPKAMVGAAKVPSPPPKALVAKAVASVESKAGGDAEHLGEAASDSQATPEDASEEASKAKAPMGKLPLPAKAPVGAAKGPSPLPKALGAKAVPAVAGKADGAADDLGEAAVNSQAAPEKTGEYEGKAKAPVAQLPLASKAVVGAAKGPLPPPKVLGAKAVPSVESKAGGDADHLGEAASDSQAAPEKTSEDEGKAKAPAAKLSLAAKAAVGAAKGPSPPPKALGAKAVPAVAAKAAGDEEHLGEAASKTQASPEEANEDASKAKAPAAKLPLAPKPVVGAAKVPSPLSKALGAKAVPTVETKADGDEEHLGEAASKTQASPEKTSEDEGKAKAPLAKLPLASKPVAGAAKGPAPLSKALGAKAVPSVEATAVGDAEHPVEGKSVAEGSPVKTSEDASKAKAPMAKLPLAPKAVVGAAKGPSPLSKTFGAKAIPAVEAKTGGDAEHLGEAATKTQASPEEANDDEGKAKAPAAKLPMASKAGVGAAKVPLPLSKALGAKAVPTVEAKADGAADDLGEAAVNSQAAPEEASDDASKAKAPGPAPLSKAVGAKAVPSVEVKAGGGAEHPGDAATDSQAAPQKTSEDEGKAKAPVAKLPLAPKPVVGAAKLPSPLSKALGAKAVPSVEAKAGGDADHLGVAASDSQAAPEKKSDDESKAKAPVGKLPMASKAGVGTARVPSPLSKVFGAKTQGSPEKTSEDEGKAKAPALGAKAVPTVEAKAGGDADHLGEAATKTQASLEEASEDASKAKAPVATLPMALKAGVGAAKGPSPVSKALGAKAVPTVEGKANGVGEHPVDAATKTQGSPEKASEDEGKAKAPAAKLPMASKAGVGTAKVPSPLSKVLGAKAVPSVAGKADGVADHLGDAASDSHAAPEKTSEDAGKAKAPVAKLPLASKPVAGAAKGPSPLSKALGARAVPTVEAKTGEGAEHLVEAASKTQASPEEASEDASKAKAPVGKLPLAAKAAVFAKGRVALPKAFGAKAVPSPAGKSPGDAEDVDAAEGKSKATEGSVEEQNDGSAPSIPSEPLREAGLRVLRQLSDSSRSSGGDSPSEGITSAPLLGSKLESVGVMKLSMALLSRGGGAKAAEKTLAKEADSDAEAIETSLAESATPSTPAIVKSVSAEALTSASEAQVKPRTIPVLVDGRVEQQTPRNWSFAPTAVDTQLLKFERKGYTSTGNTFYIMGPKAAVESLPIVDSFQQSPDISASEMDTISRALVGFDAIKGLYDSPTDLIPWDCSLKASASSSCVQIRKLPPVQYATALSVWSEVILHQKSQVVSVVGGYQHGSDRTVPSLLAGFGLLSGFAVKEKMLFIRSVCRIYDALALWSTIASPDKGEWSLCQWRWIMGFNSTGQARNISLTGFLIRDSPPADAGALSDELTPQILGLPGLSSTQLQDSLLHGCIDRFRESEKTSKTLSAVKEELQKTLNCNIMEATNILRICLAYWILSRGSNLRPEDIEVTEQLLGAQTGLVQIIFKQSSGEDEDLSRQLRSILYEGLFYFVTQLANKEVQRSFQPLLPMKPFSLQSKALDIIIEDAPFASSADGPLSFGGFASQALQVLHLAVAFRGIHNLQRILDTDDVKLPVYLNSMTQKPHAQLLLQLLFSRHGGLIPFLANVVAWIEWASTKPCAKEILNVTPDGSLLIDWLGQWSPTDLKELTSASSTIKGSTFRLIGNLLRSASATRMCGRIANCSCAARVLQAVQDCLEIDLVERPVLVVRSSDSRLTSWTYEELLKVEDWQSYGFPVVARIEDLPKYCPRLFGGAACGDKDDIVRMLGQYIDIKDFAVGNSLLFFRSAAYNSLYAFELAAKSIEEERRAKLQTLELDQRLQSKSSGGVQVNSSRSGSSRSVVESRKSSDSSNAVSSAGDAKSLDASARMWQSCPVFFEPDGELREKALRPSLSVGALPSSSGMLQFKGGKGAAELLLKRHSAETTGKVSPLLKVNGLGSTHSMENGKTPSETDATVNTKGSAAVSVKQGSLPASGDSQLLSSTAEGANENHAGTGEENKNSESAINHEQQNLNCSNDELRSSVQSVTEVLPVINHITPTQMKYSSIPTQMKFSESGADGSVDIESSGKQAADEGAEASISPPAVLRETEGLDQAVAASSFPQTDAVGPIENPGETQKSSSSEGMRAMWRTNVKDSAWRGLVVMPKEKTEDSSTS
ncbi:uncharacterized protein EMH_0036950 [Eimeria mitis]|uniref:Proteophosphoglycan ppg4, related n=1 Tax=Eimeria mitis TaxID=44415 RepID=U6JRC0_9EIME|nr:uncharacterized protein EMH_0036950 [Eimeria mitis]CDJ28015.1 hypothetical protein, conserved [Eimeria mitis]